MSDPVQNPKPDRPTLPRDVFRSQRGAIDKANAQEVLPVVVTPDYGDQPAATASTPSGRGAHAEGPRAPQASPGRRKASDAGRNPFDAYGERSSSRPYALRLPDPIDFVLRQIAAEERTFPLRIVDRILHDHLKKIGRLPPPRGT